MRRIIPILAMAALMTSCSLFNKSEKAIKPAQLPGDRESITTNTDKNNYTPEEIKQGIVKGDWAIETVYGKKVVGEEAPYLKFVPSEGRMYGNNGCNVINAGYKCDVKESTIVFDHFACTMRLCAKEGLTDYEINTAIGATKYYSVNVEGNDYYLTFYDEERQEVMTLMHQNFDFLNGTWRVTRIADEDVNLPQMKIVIDVDENKLHGNAGCNTFNGMLETDMEHPNSISFSGIAITRMMCPDIQYETKFVVALEEVSAARPETDNKVVLYDDQHEPVLTLERVN